MPDESGPAGGGDEVGKLKQELKEREEEVEELKGKLDSLKGFDLEADLDKARKLMDEEKRRSEDYLARLKYLQADFENYSKRVDRELREMEDYSTSDLMKKLLPVLDDLDLAVATVESTPEAKGLLEGVAMIRKNLGYVLEGEGLGVIEAVGQPFNAELHEAVERVDGKENKVDMVVAETRKGYVFKDRVLRPSMVKVESAVKSDSEIE
ncbi:MAG: nucleotide exchange factor GrpE [Nitrososphaerales archaeon]|jgi:molecular chaperone GrpE